MPPNSNVILMDSERDEIFYIKSSDNIGMCKLRTFNYKEVSEEVKESKYVTKEDVMQILKEFRNEQTISANKQSTNIPNKRDGEQLQIFE